MSRLEAAVLAALLCPVGCGATVSPPGAVDAAADARSDRVSGDARVGDATVSDVVDVDDSTPVPGPCLPVDPSELIAPRVLFDDQVLGLTATERGATFACGAAPMLQGRPASLHWSLVACGGCEMCNCRDPGYQASAEVAAMPVGEYSLSVGSLGRMLSVVARASCFPLEMFPASGLRVEVVGPDPGLRRDGPRIWWAHVTGTESRCCNEPRVAATVTRIRPVNADIRLELFECAPDPCDCAGRPVPIEAWVELGILSPGVHGLVTTGTSAPLSFEVPIEP